MATEIWQVDTAHSQIAFKLRHLIVAEIRAQVRRWRATLSMDPERLATTSVEAFLEAGSIETGDPERDDHIRSKEFLNVEAFPEIHFRSRSITPIDPTHYEIGGDLTIRCATREVMLEVEDLGRNLDEKGVMTARFRAHARLNRQHFGLHWNQDLDAGGVVLGDSVDIQIAVQARFMDLVLRRDLDQAAQSGLRVPVRSGG